MTNVITSEMRAASVAVILLASCAAPESPAAPPPLDRIRVAIADISSKESVGGRALAASVSEHLQDLLFECRRFEIVERKRLDTVIEEQGELSAAKLGAVAGADLVVYGVITQNADGASLHLRVVRVTTGLLAFSESRPIGMADATPSQRAARTAVEELVRELIKRFP